MSRPGERVASPALLLSVWLGLLALLALTAGSALIALGSFNVIINLCVSAAETFLIMAFYMHLRSRGGLLRTVAVAGMLWLSLLIGLALADYLTRTPLTAPW